METRHAPLLLKNMGKTWQNYVLKTSKNWCPELEPAQLANPHCSTYIYFPLMPNIHLCIPVPSTCHLSAVAGCQPSPFLEIQNQKTTIVPAFSSLIDLRPMMGIFDAALGAVFHGKLHTVPLHVQRLHLSPG